MAPPTGMPPAQRALWQKMNLELEQLLDQLSALPDDRLNRPPGPGQWSAMQVLYHLMETERLTLLYLRKKMRDPAGLPPATWRHRARSALLTLWLQSPLKARAPEAVSGDKLPERADLAEVRDAWGQTRADLEALLEGLPTYAYDRAVFRHPLAGRLTLGGMAAFLRDHFRRHRKQALRAVTAQSGV